MNSLYDRFKRILTASVYWSLSASTATRFQGFRSDSGCLANQCAIRDPSSNRAVKCAPQLRPLAFFEARSGSGSPRACGSAQGQRTTINNDGEGSQKVLFCAVIPWKDEQWARHLWPAGLAMPDPSLLVKGFAVRTEQAHAGEPTPDTGQIGGSAPAMPGPKSQRPCKSQRPGGRGSCKVTRSRPSGAMDRSRFHDPTARGPWIV